MRKGKRPCFPYGYNERILKPPAAMTEIQAEAFEGISAEVVVIPASCTAIGAKAFANCANLKYVVLPTDSNAVIDETAFEGSNVQIIYQ